MVIRTKNQTLQEHKRMWNWIAHQYAKGRRVCVYELKEEYCKFNGFELTNHCFCCDYALRRTEDYDNMCGHCPVLWDNEEHLENWYCEDGYGEHEGLYSQIYDVTTAIVIDVDEAYKLACEIANLPKHDLEEQNEEV